MIRICANLPRGVRLFATNVKKEMKFLNVAEKNDAAKTIAGLLSNGSARRREGLSVYNKIYEFETTVLGSKSKMVMTSVSGHLLHLEFLVSYRNWNNCDPLQLFEATVRKSCTEDFLPIKRTLEREIKSCQGLIVWTDCDREGENIGFEIIEVCKAIKPNITVHRAKFSEITSVGVRRALANLAQPDRLQSDAVDVRTELDLRTGAAITRLQTMRLQRLFPEKIANKLISYGSCQIPTLGFVAERYKEVEAFVSEPFWKIKVTHTIDDLTVDFNWSRNRLFDKEACEDYLLLCLAEPKAKVENVTTKPKNKWRPTPMDTVEMEKLGSRKLKLSAKETMSIAEKLYTQGIISYPRTETNMFSKEIDLKNLVQQQVPHREWGGFAQKVIEWGPNPRNGNKSDQAHPPIHPTKFVPNLSGNEARVYELIVRHFLACVSKDATGSETVVNINIAGEKFTATGLCIFERNYLDVYIYEKWNAKQIHNYEVGQIFDPTEISMQEGATTAPPLLTEADLIALMEKHGIGTDATHAEHINTIKERGYIGEVDRGCLVPGVIGMGLYEGYDAMELVLAKPMLRAAFEADLKKICLGEIDPKLVLREQIQKYKEAYKVILDKITAMDEKMSLRINETPRPHPTSEQPHRNENQIHELFKCPKCSVAHMALRKKKDSSGYYIGCLNFPDCKNAIWFSEDLNDISATQENCTRCRESSKMLKVKLNSAYYRSLFDVPDGLYKTCLLCDTRFREAFNINVDQVKRVGAIVGNLASHANGRHNPTPSIQRSTSVSNSGSQTSSSSTTITVSMPSGDQRPNPSEDLKTRKPMPRKMSTKQSSKVKKSSAQQTSIRTFASDNREAPQRVDNFNDFFDSNDGFDDVLMNANIDEVPTSTVTSNNLDNSLDMLFMNDDFEDYNWGSTGNSNSLNKNQSAKRNRVEPSEVCIWETQTLNSNNNTPPVSHSENNNACRFANLNDNVRQQETSFRSGAVSPINAEPQWGSQKMPQMGSNTTVKCTGCHQLAKELVVKKDGPNKGKPFYVCPKSNACTFFQWADENIASNGSGSQNVQPTSSASTEAVQCSCEIKANSLIVRKEGPNQGRLFYACANRSKSCGFFKWGDEDNRDANEESSWGTRGLSKTNSSANRAGTSGRTSTNAQNNPKQRKCGLCRQEGHVRSKCPRKAEFGM